MYFVSHAFNKTLVILMATVALASIVSTAVADVASAA